MATIVDARARHRSGMWLAVAVVMGLIALVAVNFTYNRHTFAQTPNIELAPSPPPATATP